jgi:hypothetical protein
MVRRGDRDVGQDPGFLHAGQFLEVPLSDVSVAMAGVQTVRDHLLLPRKPFDRQLGVVDLLDHTDLVVAQDHPPRFPRAERGRRQRPVDVPDVVDQLPGEGVAEGLSEP